MNCILLASFQVDRNAPHSHLFERFIFELVRHGNFRSSWVFFPEAETIFDAGLVPANDKYGSGLKAQNGEPACKRVGRPEKIKQFVDLVRVGRMGFCLLEALATTSLKMG